MDPLTYPAAVAHAHLLLNHVPTLGAVTAIGLFLLAAVRRNDDLWKASLEVLFVVAVMSIPAYMSGVAAYEALRNRPDFNAETIAKHQDAALISLLFMEITGGAAWFALWQFRRAGRPPNGVLAAVLALSVVTLATVTHAANLAGEIRHPEIHSAADQGSSISATRWIEAASIGDYTITHLWVWPSAETLHFIGMSLSFGVLIVVNLQLLGVMKAVPFSAVHRLLPWGMLGLGLSVATGMLFFTGVPRQYVENPAFYGKVFFLVLAALNYLYLTVFEEAWAQERGGRAPFVGRVAAVASLCLWIGVMYLGRMLPFLRGSF